MQEYRAIGFIYHLYIPYISCSKVNFGYSQHMKARLRLDLKVIQKVKEKKKIDKRNTIGPLIVGFLIKYYQERNIFINT